MTDQTLTFDQNQRSNTWVHPSQKSGRIVIVFDDLYKRAMVPAFPLANGYGLYELWLKLSCSDDTLAVGFFDLPILSEPEDLPSRMRAVQEWFERINGEVSDLIILVDIFRGMDTPSGVEVLRSLRTNPVPSFAARGRVGVLSQAGVTTELLPADPWLREYECKTFSKDDLKVGLNHEIVRFIGMDDLEQRLWPSGFDGTGGGEFAAWFNDKKHLIMTHRLSDARHFGVADKAIEGLKKYVDNVVQFSSPQHWFEPPEVDGLWEHLKHFVGSCAVPHVGEIGDRNMTLGGLVLLFGAAVGKDAFDLLNGIEWNGEGYPHQILSSAQSREQARAVAKSLAGRDGLFSKLSYHEQNGRFLITALSLTEACFSLKIDLEVLQQWKSGTGRPSLMTKLLDVESSDGDTYLAFRNFMFASAVSRRGREAKCVLNLLKDPNETLCKLEFRRCH